MNYRVFLILIISFLIPNLMGCGSDFSDLTEVAQVTGSNDNGGGGGDDGDDQEDPTLTPVSLRSVDVRITLPQDVNLDLTTATLMSQLVERPVNSDGTSLAFVEADERVIAILFDQNDNPVLMGFITDQKKDISVSSTAEVVLFLAMGTIFQPDQIKTDFLAGVSTLPGFEDFVSQTETLFRNDPNFLQSDAFKTLLEQQLATLASDGGLIDIRPRLVLDSNTRSGIQLVEQTGDNIVLNNNYRRRGHAYVYKTKSCDLDGNETTHINNIAGDNAAPVADFIVEPTTDVTSVIGSIQDTAAGKGMEFAVKPSDPAHLGLLESESKAEYKVRVIGPSAMAAQLTEEEKTRLRRLEYETIGLDMLLPVFMNMTGSDSFLADFQKNHGSEFVDAVTVFIGALPGAANALQQGDYRKVLTEVTNGIVKGTAANAFEGLFKAFTRGVVESKNISVDNSVRLSEGSAEFLKALSAVDLALQFVDVGRVFGAALSSNMLEEFCVLSTRNKITLSPRSAAVVPGESVTVEAIIQDSNLAPGESYRYEWSTSGNYGEISDSVGNQGTFFTSSRGEVQYVSTASGALPEDAQDEVFVEISIVGTGGQLTTVGEPDKPSTIKIVAESFRVRPDGVTLGYGQRLALRTILTDGSDPTDSETFDYEFVWETLGVFGLFGGSESVISKVNDNSAVYQVLESELEGTEAISVCIYRRAKEGDEAWQFLEKIQSTLKIENDPLLRYIYISPKVFSRVIANGTRIQVFQRFCFAPVKDAESYSLRILEHAQAIPTYVGRGRGWQADDPEPDNFEDGVYFFDTSGRGVGIQDAAAATATVAARAAEGLAEVQIRLKPQP